MTNDLGKSMQEKIAEMVEKNLIVSDQILQTTLKIKKYMIWLRVMSVVKFLIVIIPILLGIWYISPYLGGMQSAFGMYGELLGFGQGNATTELLKSFNQQEAAPQDVLKQIEELKKNGQLQHLLD